MIFLPYLIRIVALWLVSVVVRIGAHFGYTLSPDDTTRAVQEVALWMMTTGLPAFFTCVTIIKISLDKWLNKGNASAAPLIQQHNAESDIAKATAEYAKSRNV